MNRVWILLFALLFKGALTTAQIFAPINQTYASIKRSTLLEQLSNARPDSNEAFLLLGISDAYLKANLPDSSLFYSAQAILLSHYFHLEEVYGQGRFLACRANAMKGDIKAAENIADNSTGMWKMRMLQELSEHFAFRPGNLPSNLDSAWPYIQHIVALTDTMHSMEAKQNTRAVLGKYYYERGDLQKGMGYFVQNIREWQLAGNKEREAHWWSELGTYLPGTEETIDDVLFVHQKAKELFEQAGNKKEALYTLVDIAKWHWLTGRVDLAEKEQRQANEELPRVGQTRMYNNFCSLAIYELYLGNHNLAFQLILKAKKNMDSLQEDYAAGRIDKVLANIYWAENNIDQSLYWYQASLREIQGRRDLTVYGPALRIVQGLILKMKLKEAQQFLTTFQHDNLPIRNRDKELIATAWGNLYEALGQYEKAESYYSEMIRYCILSKEDSKKDIEEFFDYDIARPESNYTIGRFYVLRRQFARARPFLHLALEPQALRPAPLDILRNTHLLLFKVDSAAGNFGSAMQQRLLYEKFADSISTDFKAKQIAELQIQYESDKKDKDIHLLSKQALLQKADLDRSTLARNITFGVVLLTLIIIGLLYNQYRLKQKNNKALQQLVSEKEYLLREIHHRVKNNLQSIVSLLGSQSAYLSNESLKAIQDIQNRVFSIALIHQRLYQSENLAFIEMSAYLPELVSYLRDIYGIKNQILFSLDIQHLELDVSQAVPIGLILNEAITNAIKHAFLLKNKSNRISIKMLAQEHNIIHLKIADNGVGLPQDFNGQDLKSLGIKLMKGLTEDLGGSFSIRSHNGTTVLIRFVPNESFDNAVKIIASDKTTNA